MAKTLNTLFISFTFALGFFSWVYYLTKQPQLAIISGITGGALAIALAIKLNKTARKRKKASRKTYSDFSLYLCTSLQADTVIDKLLQYLDYSIKQQLTDTTLLAEKNGKKLILAKIFTVQPVKADTLIELVKTARKHKVNNVTLLCTETDAKSYSALKTVTDIKVNIVNCEQLYSTLDRCEMLPVIPKTKTTISDSALLCYAFNKARSRYYLTSAFFLLLMSLVAYFPLYLLIWATVLLAAAIYSRFNRRFNVVGNRLPL